MDMQIDDDDSSVAATVLDEPSDDDNDDGDAADEDVRVTSDDDDDDDDDFDADGHGPGPGTFVDRPCVDADTLAVFAVTPRITPCFMASDAIMTCPNILQHCKTQVRNVISRYGGPVCCFKIGISCTPIRRFRFYQAKNWEEMVLLHASIDVDVTNMLEAALIDIFWDTRGCFNEARGGEGNCHLRPPPYYTYVVAARADGRYRIG